jgi:hypothetical protein
MAAEAEPEPVADDAEAVSDGGGAPAGDAQ